MTRLPHDAALAACLILGAAAGAQTPPATGGALGGLAGLTGKSRLLGGVLPDVGGASVGNAAGVLSYCVKNKLVGGAGAQGALGALLGKPEVTASKGFATGQSGKLVTGQGAGLSLDSVKGKLKSKVCDMVLQHAKSFI